jgi:hypothetical protein
MMLDLFGFLVSVVKVGMLGIELPLSNRSVVFIKVFQTGTSEWPAVPQEGHAKGSSLPSAATCKNAVWRLIIMP